MLAYREDYVGKASFQPTPQGGVRCDSARLTRTGVLVYTDPSTGKTRRELRHPDEVFNQDSLASLKGAPITIGHPAVVTPENFSQHSTGHVAENVARDGRYVASTLYVQRADGVSGVKAKKFVELSCGYHCDFDPTPGTFDGEEYDGIQRNIRYNHVGMGPPGWGRAGSDVRIRQDGQDPLPEGAAYHVDSSEYSHGDMDLQKELDVARIRIDGLNSELGALKAERDRISGERDALKTEADKLRTDAAPEAFEARVTARLALVEDAKAVLPEANFTGKTDAQVMQAVIEHSDKALKLDGKSNDYLRGQFDRITLTAKGVAKKNAETREALDKAEPRTDGNEVSAAQSRQAKRDADLWKGTEK